MDFPHIQRARRVTLAACLVVAAVLAVPTERVEASVIVGADLGVSPDSWQPGSINVQRRLTDVPGTTYGGFSSAGVLTSVSIKTRGAANTATAFVLRKTADLAGGAATFSNITSPIVFTVPEDPSTGTVHTQATRISVAAGDRFGMTTASTGTWHLYWHSAPEFDYCYFRAGSHAEGASLDYASALCNNYIPLVQGVLEPDVDGDGYGDETQDLCPVDPASQTQCQADLSVKIKRASRPRPGLRAVLHVTVTNNGPTPARNVVVKLDRASKLKSFGFPLGACSTLSARLCTAASLAPGATAIFTARAIKRRAGKVKMIARVSSDVLDPIAANNMSSATVKFKR